MSCGSVRSFVANHLKYLSLDHQYLIMVITDGGYGKSAVRFGNRRMEVAGLAGSLLLVSVEDLPDQP